MFRIALASALVLWAGSASAADKLQFGPPGAWVKPAAISPPASDPNDLAPARRLLVDVQLRFDKTGDDFFADSAIRIQTTQGLSSGAVTLTWRPDVDAVTVHQVHILRGDQVIDVLGRGQTFTILRRETNLERAMLDGVLTATLQPEGLQVGDIVEFSYTRKRLDPVMQGRSESVVAQLPGAASDRLRMRAIWPATKPMRWRQIAGLNPAALTTTAAGAELVTDTLHAERPKPPNGAPLRYNFASSIEVSEFADWAEVSALMAPLYRKATTLAADSPIKVEAAKIRAASSDPKVQAAAALHLVQDRIRYLFLGMDLGGYVPADADVTWARRFGDCKAKTAVLLALLQELGISAEPALVSTVAGDGMDERLPNIELFNHILIRAQIGGKTYWMDGTRSDDRALDDLPVPAFHWALPVRSAGATLEKLVVPPLNKPNLITSIRLDATAGLDAPAPAHLEVAFRGDAGSAMRQMVGAIPRSELDSKLRAYWAGEYSWIEIQSANFAYDEATGESRLIMDGAANMDWPRNADTGAREYESDGGRVGAKADYKREPGPNQNAPYAVEYPVYSSATEVILLPQGGKGFSVVGADVDQTVAGAAYKRQARIENGVFTMTAERRTITAEFPASEAPANRQALRELWDALVYIRAPKTWRATDQELAIRLSRKPSTVAAYLDQAEGWMDKGDHDKALQDWDAAIQLKPDDARALNARCFGRGRLGVSLESALSDCDAALDLAPKSANYLDSRGFVYFRLGKADKAIADLDQALKIDPTIAPSLYVRGLAKRLIGDRKGADQDVAAARRLDPGVAATYSAFLAAPRR